MEKQETTLMEIVGQLRRQIRHAKAHFHIDEARILESILVEIVECAKLRADAESVRTIDNHLGLGAYDRELKYIPMPSDTPAVLKFQDAHTEEIKTFHGETWSDARAQLATYIKTLKHE